VKKRGNAAWLNTSYLGALEKKALLRVTADVGGVGRHPGLLKARPFVREEGLRGAWKTGGRKSQGGGILREKQIKRRKDLSRLGKKGDWLEKETNMTKKRGKGAVRRWEEPRQKGKGVGMTIAAIDADRTEKTRCVEKREEPTKRMRKMERSFPRIQGRTLERHTIHEEKGRDGKKGKKRVKGDIHTVIGENGGGRGTTHGQGSWSRKKQEHRRR